MTLLFSFPQDLNSDIKFKTLNSFAFIVIEVPNPDFLAKVHVLFAFGNWLYSELKTLLFFGIHFREHAFCICGFSSVQLLSCVRLFVTP